MLKLLLLIQLWHQDTTNHLNSLKDTESHHSYSQGAVYSTGLIPEISVYPSTSSDSFTNATNNFKDPYKDVHIPTVADVPLPTTYSDSARIIMQKFADAPTSEGAKNQNQYFDWDKTNASRFVNSPCYQSLGFDPKGNLAEQESRYTVCEHEHSTKTVTDVLIGGLVIAGIVVLLYLAVKKT